MYAIVFLSLNLKKKRGGAKKGGARVKDCKWPLEARKGEEKDTSPKPLKQCMPGDALFLDQCTHPEP